MRINTKHSIGLKTENKFGINCIFDFSLKKKLFNKTDKHIYSRHTVKKARNNGVSKEIEETTVHYNKYNANHIKRNKPLYKSFNLLFIIIISSVLSISTIFYIWAVSGKIIEKKNSIIDLYSKYENIKEVNKKSKILLSSLEQTEAIEGNLFMITDSNKTIEEEYKLAINRYINMKKNGPLFIKDSMFTLVLFSFLVILGLIFIRIFILYKKEQFFPHKKYK